MFLTRKVYHVEIYLWILLGIFMGIVLFYCYIQFSAPQIKRLYSQLPQEKKTTLEEALSTVDNGDLILMTGDTRGEKTCRWAAKSVFSHTGFLFRETHPATKENILYIWDCDMGQGSKEGVRIMPLRTKLARYKGFRIAAIKRLLSQRRPTTEEIVSLIPKYLKLDFDSKILTWWAADKNSPDGGWLYRQVKNSSEVFCSELVALTLQELGVMERDRVPAWYSPGDFDRGNLRLKKGFSYGPTLYFEFPEEEVKKMTNQSTLTSIGEGAEFQSPRSRSE